jgi:hypothetical protein
MNAERLRWLAEQLLAYEKEAKVRKTTQQIADKVAELAGNPQAQNLQSELASLIENLRAADEASKQPRFTPAQEKIVAELGGEGLFGPPLVGRIQEIISRHGITVNVAAQEVRAVQQKQQAFFDALEKIIAGFEALGIKANKLSPGEAEIGFLLPEDLYEHRLDRLGDEIEVLSKMLRVIVEFQQGRVEEFRIRSIAASDLLIYIAMGAPAIVALGRLVTWGLDTIERVLRVRKLLQQLRDENMDPASLSPLESDVRQKAEIEARQKAQEIADASPLPVPRKNELKGALEWSLESLIAHLERGMAVEIRLLPPAKPKGEAAQQPEAHEAAQQFNELATVASNLRVLAPVGEPILPLPAPPNERLPPSQRPSAAAE